MAEVSLNNIYKTYDDTYEAVRDFNLDIEDGEFLVLVGPSGCGKSTTLRMVAGLEDITKGDIRISDRIVNDVPPKDRNIAMVFQNYALYPHMNVYDNMAFGLKLRKLPKAEISERVNKAAAILGLEELLKRKPKALSGGQRQRVAMGRAIVREPAVFLFDEPLSNLDAKMRVEMRKEILQLHGRIDTTMIYVTHDQVEAMTLGDRICVMNVGIIEQVGPPTVIFDHPASLFVARFIGTPPMNLFEGTLRAENGGLVFDGDSIQCPLPPEKAAMLQGCEGKKV
jgi:multiple sugar transport system ATP-binding protein